MNKCILALAATCFCTITLAQTNYPARPVQVIIGWAAGSNLDMMARHLLTSMSAQLGQQFVVVNRDGAIGTIGVGQVASAKPDGYILGAGRQLRFRSGRT